MGEFGEEHIGAFGLCLFNIFQSWAGSKGYRIGLLIFNGWTWADLEKDWTKVKIVNLFRFLLYDFQGPKV